jgi:hypothetical protein
MATTEEKFFCNQPFNATCPDRGNPIHTKSNIINDLQDFS